MNSLKITKIFVCAMLVLVSTPTIAAPPDWSPSSVDIVPFESVDLDTAQSVLYLDNTCQVVAHIVPTDSEISSYLPKLPYVKKRWWERKDMYRPAKACPDKSKFLDLDHDSGTQPKACMPNELVTAADLVGNMCRVKSDAINTVIVLDVFQEPVLILEGKLASTTAKGVVPATYLGRAKFQGGAPCSPTVPSPCYPPRQGVLKQINGQQICVCQ